MITAGQIRAAIAELADDVEVIISIDVSRHGEDEEEAGKRAFADELTGDLETTSDRRGRNVAVTLCCVGQVNF